MRPNLQDRRPVAPRLAVGTGKLLLASASKARALIDLARYNVIDLSEKVQTALLKRDGDYTHGYSEIGRIVYLEEFSLAGWPGVKMHFVRGETHTGTHVEAPYKVFDEGKDVTQLPLDSFIGEAVVVDCSGKKAGESITGKELEEAGVREGDRVLVRGPAQALTPIPYLTEEATNWLIKKKIKLLALQNCTEYLPDQLNGKLPKDTGNALELFRNEVVIVDGIVNLEKIKKKRVFLIALPLNFTHLETSWARVVALEERE
jgi:arylformamidase